MYRAAFHRRQANRRHHRYLTNSEEDSASSSDDVGGNNLSSSSSDDESEEESIPSSSSTSDDDEESDDEGGLVNVMSSFSEGQGSDDDDRAGGEVRLVPFTGSLKPRSFKSDEDSESFSSSSSTENSDSSDDDSPVHTGAAISRNIKAHSRFVFNSQGEETPDSQPPSQNNATTPAINNLNRPLSPWKNSTSKNRIIAELKNEQSSIRTLASAWEENIDQIWQQYAPQYQRSKFKGYMKTIMKNYDAKKGPFKADEAASSLWEESSSKKRIIEDLKDHESSIHTLVKDWEKNLDELWKEYAPGYQRSKFKGYLETIITNYRAKKGPFKDTWYDKKKGIHDSAYSLLYQLMMKGDIDDLSIPQVHTQNSYFCCKR